jgi:hypothetical protein
MKKLIGHSQCAAYWQHQFDGEHIHVAGMNCTRHVDFGSVVSVRGFELRTLLKDAGSDL